MRDALRKVQTGKHKDTTIDAEYDRLLMGLININETTLIRVSYECNIKNDRIDMLMYKDLKDSIRQVAYNNGYNLSHYLNRMIMNGFLPQKRLKPK